MNCIFCKSDSTNSKSVEHIVPESLGNKSHTLPPGIVCDKCNNYFATKIEKYFLESGAINSLRFDQLIKSKRNKIPPVKGILSPYFPAKIYKKIDSEDYVNLSLETTDEGLNYIKSKTSGKVLLPYSYKPPEKFITSRFLAKMALELLVKRVMKVEGGINYIVEEKQLDPLRYHAREGRIRNWPFYERRIYPANRIFKDDSGKNVQTIFEFDIFTTENSEYYFVFALFGLELTINIGGPEIEGYKRWLEKHKSVSPLYI